MAARHANRLVALGLLWAFGLTLLRGLRRPNDWAEAHWLISYRFGFIKRGLPATLLQPFTSGPSDRAETAITVVSTLLTAGLCVVLLYVCLTILRRSGFSVNSVVAVAVFVTSPFVVMTGHLNGYFDAQIIILSVLAIWLAWQGRTWAAAVVLLFGLLVHETIVVIGYPAVIWAVLMRMTAHHSDSPHWRPLIPLVLPLIAFAALFLYQSYATDPARLESELISHLQAHPFIQYDQEIIVPRSFAKPFTAQFMAQSPRVWGRLFDMGMMMVVLPSIAVWLLFIRGALRAGNASPLVGIIGALLPFAPLGLHLIAWDTARIWTYPLVVALLVAWIACLAAESTRLQATDSRLLTLMGLLVLPINVFGRIPLMDWRVERFGAAWRAALYAPSLVVVALALARRRPLDYTTGDRQLSTE